MNGKWTLNVRADASSSTGYGHLFRSKAVANALTAITDIDVCYLLTSECDQVIHQEYGHRTKAVGVGTIDELTSMCTPQEGPVLVDSYRYSQKEMHQLHEAGFCLVQFDDGCRFESYFADLVIDSAPVAMSQPYKGLPETMFLLGSKYFPLRQAVRAAIGRQHHENKATRVAITFGGSDPDDATGQVLRALCETNLFEQIIVILGPGYCGEVSEATFEDRRVAVLRNPSDYIEQVLTADMVICSAGITAWEFAHLGIPMLLLVISENQRANAAALIEAKAAIGLGELTNFDANWLVEAARETSDDRLLREMLSQNGRSMIDDQGANRVAQEIAQMWTHWNNG